MFCDENSVHLSLAECFDGLRLPAKLPANIRRYGNVGYVSVSIVKTLSAVVDRQAESGGSPKWQSIWRRFSAPKRISKLQYKN